MVKPFVKWAGGKGKLIPKLEDNLPKKFGTQERITYIEPFVGGGAMLFSLLEKYENIQRAIINDINPALINCYRIIKNEPDALIGELQDLRDSYFELHTHEGRRAFYNACREAYNEIPVKARDSIHTAALFVFMNKTCFNGLYRENKKGGFNVPYGKHVRPGIYDEKTIMEAHKTLQRVEIMQGNYANVLKLVNWDEYNFFYFDPPYRPLSPTKKFNQYSMYAFNDPEQEALRDFCAFIDKHGGHFMLSNSDSELEPGVSYFDKLYKDFHVFRISAPRLINAFIPGRQTENEILVRNY